MQFGAGLNLATLDTFNSSFNRDECPLEYKFLVDLIKRNKLEDAYKLIRNMKKDHISFREGMAHYLMCIYDPFKYQSFIPIPFTSTYSLLHYTLAIPLKLAADNLRTTVIWAKTDYNSLAIRSGSDDVRTSLFRPIIPPSLTSLINEGSVQVVSAAMTTSPDSSLLNTNGRVYSYIINDIADPTIQESINSVLSYNGHIKDGSFVTYVPTPIGMDNSPQGSPFMGTTLTGFQENITVNFKIVIMCRFKSPYNTIVSKISHNFDNSLYQFNFGDIIDTFSDLYACSGVNYTDPSRIKRIHAAIRTVTL